MTDLPWRFTRSLFAAPVLLAGSAAVCPPAMAAPHPLPALLPGLLSAGLVDGPPQPITAALARVYLKKLPVGQQSSLDGYDHAKFLPDLVRPELVAVSESANMDKSGSSPATWRPPVTGYWCTYARSWVTVKYHYDLRVTEREKDALADMLESCPTNP